MVEPARRSAWSRFFGRARTRVALAALALLYAGAIYAPLIANDRPLRLDAVHVKEYRAAWRSLVPATQELARWSQFSLVPDVPKFPEEIEREARAVSQRIATLASALSESDRAALGALERAVDHARAGEGGGDLVELARRAQEECRPFDPADPAVGGKVLQSRVSYPLLESLRAVDVFFMVLGPLCIAAVLWSRVRYGSRSSGQPVRWWNFVAVLAIAAAGAFLWELRAGPAPAFASSSYKADVQSGALVVNSVVFPPIAMGFAETNLSESYRPPTWTSAARAHGPRPVLEPEPRSALAPPSNTPIDVHFAEPAADSAWRHPLGTDSVGRDLLVRLIWGGRVSLVVGLVSALLLTVIGTLVGAIAGYCGGLTDLFVSRVIEVVLCFPAFFLILIAVAFTDPSVVPPLFAIAAVIALVGWTGVARLARAEFLRLRAQEFVLAAKALGFSHARILFVHMLPNALGPVLVAGAFAVASGVLVESALSFLGFGIAHPVPSWGALASESHSADHWWLQLFPGFFIFVTVVAYNLAGESLRDALDPRLED